MNNHRRNLALLIGLVFILIIGFLTFRSSDDLENKPFARPDPIDFPWSRVSSALITGETVGGRASHISSEMQPPAADASQSIDELSVDQLVGHVSNGSTELGLSSHTRLRELVSTDPNAQRKIISLYETAADGATKSALLGVLTAQDSPEVQDLIRRMVQGSASQRKDAYELLSSIYSSKEARNTLLHAIANEQDTQMLSQAINALRPTNDPDQIQATISTLGHLVRSSDPQVRSASLQALAQSDKSGSVAEPFLYQAISESDPAARSGALYGVLYNEHIRSDRVKSVLIGIISSPSGSGDISMALRALERFQLSSSEYAIYSRASDLINATASRY